MEGFLLRDLLYTLIDLADKGIKAIMLIVANIYRTNTYFTNSFVSGVVLGSSVYMARKLNSLMTFITKILVPKVLHCNVFYHNLLKMGLLIWQVSFER